MGNILYSIEDGVHTAYHYDDNGNLLTVAIDHQLTTYTWTPKDELAQVVVEEKGIIRESASCH